MNTYEIAFLIRGLIVSGMVLVLVIAGAFFARREKHRASNTDNDNPTASGQRPATIPRSLGEPAHVGQREADHFGPFAPGVQRRAA